MTRYVGLIDGEAGGYGIIFPDLPGCTAAAATVDEVMRHAVESVAAWIDDAIADGEQIPAARSMEDIRTDPKVVRAIGEGAALVLIPLVRDEGRPAKANISMDAGLLAAIDDAAAARGLTRSAFLVSAAREKITSGR